MPRRKYTPQNIFDMIQRFENGEEAKDIRFDYGIGIQNFLRFKKKYKGMTVKQIGKIFDDADSEAQIKRIKAAEENKKNPPNSKSKKKYRPPQPDPNDAKYTINFNGKIKGISTPKSLKESIAIGLMAYNTIFITSKENPKNTVKILLRSKVGFSVSLIKSNGNIKTRTFTEEQIKDPAEAIASIIGHLS